MQYILCYCNKTSKACLIILSMIKTIFNVDQTEYLIPKFINCGLVRDPALTINTEPRDTKAQL